MSVISGTVHTPLRLFALLLCLLTLALPALASDYDDHLAFKFKNSGTCKEMTGRINAVVLFVSTDEAAWTQNDIAAMKQHIVSAADTLHQEASAYGVTLSMTTEYYTSRTASLPDRDNSEPWVSELLDSLDHLPDREGSGFTGMPLVICLNADGRAFAHSESSDTEAEYVILYSNANAGTVRHELLHLYGARDFYLPGTFLDAANAYFPKSIMLASNADNVTDDVTAYTIGWTDTLTDSATAFLNDTRHLTSDMYSAAQKGNQITGYATVQLSGGVYTGMLQDGFRHGIGEMVYSNGNVCTGEWYMDQAHGIATYTWADGDTYTGAYVNGKRTGRGTLTWDSGSSYTGDFVDGKRTGRGTYIWADGDMYIGDFVNNKRSGKGTMIWASGDTYTGDYIDDIRTGKGTYTWGADSQWSGDVYTGDFINNQFHGKGTYTWANGDVYTGDYVEGKRSGKGFFKKVSGLTYSGDFLNNKYHGKGTLSWPGGDFYTGDFVDGYRTGKGTYTWASGGTYTGDFVENVRTGKGTYTWTNGDTYTGDFVNDKRHGTGVLTRHDGTIQSGQWENGVFVQ